MNDAIAFQVDTSRILKILASEIYDSPLAMLRENVQNAYDAVRQRFAATGQLADGGRIDVRVAGGQVSVADNGIGMTEDQLRLNFWKAGASGKQTASAKQAGVVGTFGIGAMANFGVCSSLTVETQHINDTQLLRSTAVRDELRIAEECISLERLPPRDEPGTTVTAVLDGAHPMTTEAARRYLEPYVALLPVPLYVNGALVSGGNWESRPPFAGRRLTPISSDTLRDNLLTARFEVRVDPNGQVAVVVTDIAGGGGSIDGMVALMQGGGQLLGLRSWFGLAPVPVAGHYQFGGIANLAFLHPTAGREALTRESVRWVAQLVVLAERAASQLIALTSHADKNVAFLHWIKTNARTDLGDQVSVRVLPEAQDVALGKLSSFISGRPAHYYKGTDQQILTTFASQGTVLVHVAQTQPRRSVQLAYLRERLKLEEVPDSVQVTRTYEGSELTLAEASILLRVAAILREDYLLPETEVAFADMSHSVSVLAQKQGDRIRLLLAKKAPVLKPLLECYDKAYDLFSQFMKDFVRVHVYPRIQEYVPSSTRGGVEALRRTLERNRELYRYEEAERGDFEDVLGEYLSGAASFGEMLRSARSRSRPQTQRVTREQVGSIENVLPGITSSPIETAPTITDAFAAMPPILREEIVSEMKILTTARRYHQLNNFTVLLGLSDRLIKMEAAFFRTPHTTRILWGGHRVIYIFTEVTGRLSLYYDIELREPLANDMTGGGMVPTTTLITRKRIFVPVPEQLTNHFKVTTGAKEFFVRFDMLSAQADSHKRPVSQPAPTHA